MPPPKRKPPTAMLYGEAARTTLLRGMEQMTRLLRPTLGPVARTVAVASLLNGQPEILDDGATIARRTIELSDPFESIGAMVIRHVAWRVHETVGDGATTAAVIATRLMAEAVRVIAAGASPVGVRRGVEEAMEVVRAELEAQARPIELPEEIARIVLGTVRDEKIAEMIGEIVEGVGEDGAVLVENAHGIETSYQYLEGIYWDEGWHSPSFLREHEATVRLIDPRILITDQQIERPDELLPVLDACARGGVRSLMVIAPEIKDEALSLLIVNRERGILESVAVKTPSHGDMRTGILEDIAASTGGRCFRREVGESIATATVADLGMARQAWARPRSFGILGGHGAREVIRSRIVAARAELATVKDNDWLRRRLQERIGKLSGSAVMIVVGAATEAARDELKLRIESAVTMARAAVRDGVVPGGGAAYLACAAPLERAVAGRRDDEALGWRILAAALSEPMRAICANAGLDGRAIVAQAAREVPDRAYDVWRGAWVDPWEAGLLDSATVLRTALDGGVSAATSALTSEVLIHRPGGQPAFSP
ncbi:MAG TPA: chaperonin GroEL [Chloroflexota bacterium]|nr:chaperonin GroEL [Chloroflexota bacterium]